VKATVVFISYVLLILQYPKYCGFYRFHKVFLQMLKDAGVIVFRPSNWAGAVDELVDSEVNWKYAITIFKDWRSAIKNA
jgi:hypothetical protein